MFQKLSHESRPTQAHVFSTCRAGMAGTSAVALVSAVRAGNSGAAKVCTTVTVGLALLITIVSIRAVLVSSFYLPQTFTACLIL